MSEGPFVYSLDKALGAMNVHRQVYYGGKFSGNHVHKCLKVSSYNQIITIKIYGPFSIYSQRMSTHFAQQSCPSLTATAHSICKKHKKVMALFSDCHQMYNSAEEMTSTDADVLGMLKLLLLLIYTCCYCQISIISFYLSTSHNNTQNALLGGPHSAVDQETENWNWISRRAGWGVYPQSTWAFVQLHPQQSGVTTSHYGSPPYTSVPRTGRMSSGSCLEKEIIKAVLYWISEFHETC